MLREFITAHRSELIARCREMITSRRAPRPTQDEIEEGVPLFLDHLVATLQPADSPSGPAWGCRRGPMLTAASSCCMIQ